MPCKIPIGNMIAPATRNPHKPCAKQVKMWVSHAAKQPNPMSAPNIDSLLVLVFGLPKVEQGLEHSPATASFLGCPLFDHHEAGL